jgi:hypothetical protein
MRLFLAGLVLSLVLSGLAAAPAHALTEADVEPTIGPNEAYEQAIRGERVDSDITYLRPSAPFEPDGDIRIDVPERETERSSSSWGWSRWFWIILFGALLAGLLFIIIRNSGAVSVSFKATNEKARKSEAPSSEGLTLGALSDQPIDSFLERLKAMADRREALILLVSRALELAAEKNDIRLGRAQTARDVVRVLPKSWRHLTVMRRLVREAEVVHFGGRDVSEERWDDCLAAAKPIFAEGRTA